VLPKVTVELVAGKKPDICYFVLVGYLSINISMNNKQLLSMLRAHLEELEHQYLHEPSEDLVKQRLDMQARIMEVEAQVAQGN
jgi:hypothetical protein